MSDTLEALDAVGYVLGFWFFVLLPGYRRRRWAEFRSGGVLKRLGLAFDATIATVCGIAVPGIVVWLITA